MILLPELMPCPVFFLRILVGLLLMMCSDDCLATMRIAMIEYYAVYLMFYEDDYMMIMNMNVLPCCICSTAICLFFSFTLELN